MAEGIYDALNRSLFLQLDNLQDCEPEQLSDEIERSKQVANLAAQVIANQNAALSMLKFQASEGMDRAGLAAIMPKALGDGR